MKPLTIQFKPYTDVLYDNEKEKQEFFETLILLLEPSRKKYNPQKSRKEYSESFIREVLRCYWEVVLERLIMENETLYFRDLGILSVARVPFRQSNKVFQIPQIYRLFFSKLEYGSDKKIRFTFRRKYKVILKEQIKQGHTYNFGKPIIYGNQ